MTLERAQEVVAFFDAKKSDHALYVTRHFHLVTEVRQRMNQSNLSEASRQMAKNLLIELDELKTTLKCIGNFIDKDLQVGKNSLELIGGSSRGSEVASITSRELEEIYQTAKSGCTPIFRGGIECGLAGVLQQLHILMNRINRWH